MGVMRQGAARPMRADARRNHELLLAAARQAVDEQGAEIALDDVARRAGVGIGTLYRHFPTRDALLQAVLADRFEELTARVREAAAAAETPLAALVAFMRLFRDHMAATRGLIAAVKPALKDDATQVSAAHARMREISDALLERAQRCGQVRADITPVDLYRLVAGVVWSTEARECTPAQTRADSERLLSVVVSGLLS